MFYIDNNYVTAVLRPTACCKFDSYNVVKAINAKNGEFKITTVQGGILTASLSAANVIFTDTKGNKSTVVIAIM